ncbi:MAG: hypothetical protein J0H62_07785 [Rhizobiales bacterium]|nr:hypothetical protein [Hyphomicrobiales bacterium]
MNRVSTMPWSRRKSVVWLLIGLGLLLLIVANGHLVYVATTSQPDCVAHVRQGEANGTGGRFSAARSSCSPS